MPSAFSTTNTIYVAVDFAHGGDCQAECFYSINKNGEILIHDIHQYRQSIEIETQHDNRPTRPDLPDAGGGV